MVGPVLRRTYRYPGWEIDLIARNLVPAGLPVRPQGAPAAWLRLAIGEGRRHGRRSFRALSI